MKVTESDNIITVDVKDTLTVNHDQVLTEADIGTTTGTVSEGNHKHTVSDITDFNSGINLKGGALSFDSGTNSGTKGMASSDSGKIYGEHDENTETSRLVIDVADNNNDSLVMRTGGVSSSPKKDAIKVDYNKTTFHDTPYVGTNKIWHEGNDGLGSGLDADKLDGAHKVTAINDNSDASIPTEKAVKTYVDDNFDKKQGYGKTITETGWYRIAKNGPVEKGQSGGDRAFGSFSVIDFTSGFHSSVKFYASISFGKNPTLTMLNRSMYGSNGVIRKIRIIEGNTYEGAAVEVYAIAREESGSSVQFYLSENDQRNGWMPLNWEKIDSIPEGFSETRLDLDTHDPVLATAANSKHNGFIVKRDGSIKGQSLTTTGNVGIGTTITNNRLNIDGTIGFCGDDKSKFIGCINGFGGDQYGIGMKINSGGDLVLGSGEAANSLKNHLDITGKSENLYLGSDYSMYLYTGCQKVEEANIAMSALSNGNVGIGTANPNAKLDVNGDMRVTGTITGKASDSDKLDGAHKVTVINDNSDSSIPTEKAVKTYVENILNNYYKKNEVDDMMIPAYEYKTFKNTSSNSNLVDLVVSKSGILHSLIFNNLGYQEGNEVGRYMIFDSTRSEWDSVITEGEFFSKYEKRVYDVKYKNGLFIRAGNFYGSITVAYLPD